MGGTITRPVGLEFSTVLAMGAALEVDQTLLAQVLPDIEAAILTGMDGDSADEEVMNG